MTTFTDLVPQAQPALRRAPAAGTAGATWRWRITLTDYDGDSIDLTDLTASCVIVDNAGTVIVTPTVTLGDGELVIEVDEAITATLAPNRTTQHLRWALTVTDGTDTVQFWATEGSPFVIYPAA